jgi:hypothetical protein
LQGKNGTPSLQAPCPPPIAWAWISNLDPFRTFLLGSLNINYILTSELF